MFVLASPIGRRLYYCSVLHRWWLLLLYISVYASGAGYTGSAELGSVLLVHS